jgi:tetratricopeptide (TPR) repeat protein
MDRAQIESMFEAALAAGRRRDYRRAIELLNAIVAVTDEFPQALLYLGRSLHAVGDIRRAVGVLRFFVRRRPSSSAGHFFLGRSYLALDLPDRAASHLSESIRLRPDFAPAESLAGLAFLKLRRPGIAIQHLERAVHLDPSNRSVFTGYLNALLVQAIKSFHRGDVGLAEELFSFVHRNGNGSILPMLYLAGITRERGDLTAALAYYDECHRLAPEDTFILAQRINLLYKTGRDKEAGELLRTANIDQRMAELVADGGHTTERYVAMYLCEHQRFRQAVHHARRVLRRHPEDLECQLVMAESYRRLGDLGKARNHFLRSIRKNRKRTETRFGLILVLWQLEQYDAILQELTKVERIDPNNRFIPYYRALCRAKLSASADTIIPELLAQVAAFPDDPVLYAAIGAQFLAEGMLDDAERWFRQTLAYSESHREALEGLITVARQRQDAAMMEAAYHEFLNVYAEEVDTRHELIQHLIDNGRYAAARNEILKQLPYRRNDEQLQRLLALCYRRTRMYTEAAGIYRQLLRRNPNDQDYLLSLVYSLDKAGSTATAIEYLEASLAHFRSQDTLRLILGVLYFRNGRPERALAVLRDMLASSPLDWRVYKNIGVIYKKTGNAAFAEKFLKRAEQYRRSAPSAAESHQV